jgi:hypothetical protein
MNKYSYLVAFAIIGLFVSTTSASALQFSVPPLPDFPAGSWTAGTAVKYHVNVTKGSESFGFNLRLAVLGSEDDNGTTVYWTEFDLTELENLPEDLSQMMVEYYHEAPYALRMLVLIPEYDLLRIYTDPSQVYADFITPGFIRSMMFQYNRFVPYDVDTALIGGFILPLIMSDLMGEDLPEDFLEGNLGVEMIEDTEGYITEMSESEITVEAGTFDGTLWTYTGAGESGGAGTMFYTSGQAVIPIVTAAMNWISGSTGNFDMELMEVVESGAETEIIGMDQAVRFDLQTLMM